MKKEINPILKSFYDFLETVGEGTNWDLDYGKLVIIALLIYIAFFKTYGELTTIGQLRDQCISIVQMYESLNQS